MESRWLCVTALNLCLERVRRVGSCARGAPAEAWSNRRCLAPNVKGVGTADIIMPCES